ncbi:hypothetical protein DXG01_002675 [Tephrocybe rancida]|nr:hypothetical protein DXG01_002675 [Tephrocybe rancida]
MQNPKHDIEAVLMRVLSTQSPDEQKKAIKRYFTENVAFRYPLYNVAAGQQSREDVLGIHQWLRVVSPTTGFEATNIVFDEESSALYVEGTIFFQMRYSPFVSQPSKVLILMKLKKNDQDYLISSQEYFYHADQLSKQLFPPLAPVIKLTVSTLTYASAIGAKLAQVIGIWRVSDDGSINGADDKGSYAEVARAPPANANRAESVDSRTSEETRVGASESERHVGGDASPHKMLNGKHRKRRDASGHHAVANT